MSTPGFCCIHVILLIQFYNYYRYCYQYYSNIKNVPDQCTNNTVLDQSLPSYTLQVTHQSCKYALTHQ